MTSSREQYCSGRLSFTNGDKLHRYARARMTSTFRVIAIGVISFVLNRLFQLLMAIAKFGALLGSFVSLSDISPSLLRVTALRDGQPPFILQGLLGKADIADLVIDRGGHTLSFGRASHVLRPSLATVFLLVRALLQNVSSTIPFR